MLPYIPFYKKLFKRYGIDPFKLDTPDSWHDLGLPLIKKATYMKNPRDFIVTPDAKALFQNHLDFLACQHELASMANILLSPGKKEHLNDYYTPKMLVLSGGTESGHPTPVFLTATQKFETLMGILSLLGKLIPLEEHTRGMNLFPYAPHLGWHAVHHALDINVDLNLCTAAGGAMPTTRLVDMAKTAQPNVICGMNDYLRNRFLPLAIQQKIKLPKTVLFITGAQKLLEPEREQLRQLARKLGVHNPIVIDFYGASEYKEALLPECTPGSGFHHLAPLSTIIKTVDVHHATKDVIDDWDFTPTGYAASWNIDGAGTLLAGYFIGDHIEHVSHDACTHCGLNTTRFFNVNRIRDIEAQLRLTGIVEEKVKGSRVNLVAIRETALRNKNITEAQVVLKKKRNIIELRYVSTAPQQTKKQLRRAFERAEIKPKLIPTTLQKLQGSTFKFEPIRVE